MPNKLYLPRRRALHVMRLAENTREMLANAYEGMPIADLTGYKPAKEGMVQLHNFASIFIAAFDRSAKDEHVRREEKIYRLLLPGIVKMVSPRFIVDQEAIDDPQASSGIIASVLTESREIAVVRCLMSSETLAEDHQIDPAKLTTKLLPGGGLPGLIHYQMAVEDITSPKTSRAAQV